jgi:hypothetical protein
VSTERRRLVWQDVVWLLVLDLDRPYFTLEEYHAKRNQICELYGIPHAGLSGGFISLVSRGSTEKGRGFLLVAVSAHTLHAKASCSGI